MFILLASCKWKPFFCVTKYIIRYIVIFKCVVKLTITIWLDLEVGKRDVIHYTSCYTQNYSKMMRTTNEMCVCK